MATAREELNRLRAAQQQPPTQLTPREELEQLRGKAQQPAPIVKPSEPEVPEWGKKYPTAYGVAGAAYETAKPVVEALGLVGGAIVGTPVGPAGQVGGAALGYAAAKNLIELAEERLGVKLPQTAIEQIKDLPKELAEGAIMEMGGQVAGKVIPAAVKAVAKPVQTLLQKTAEKALKEPLAREGIRVAEATGMELTPGQMTGSRFLLTAENVARRAGMTTDQIHKHDVKVAGQAIERINKLTSKLGKKGVSETSLGQQVQGAVSHAVKSVQKMRRGQAAIDYGRVRKLAGDKPVVQLGNLKAEINKIIDDFDVPGGSAIVKQAKGLLGQVKTIEKVTPPSKILDIHGKPVRGAVAETVEPKITIDKAMKIRSVYSDAARGTGQVFKDIDHAQNRMLASRLIKAVEKDFEVVPTTATGNISEAMNIANKNYKTYSQSLDAIENSVLGKMLGKDVNDAIITGQGWNTIAPEQIVNRLVKMHPSELKAAKAILQKTSPETWGNLKRYSVDRALTAAMDIPPAAGLNPIPLSSSKFIKALPKEAQARVLFDKRELSELKMINNALIRFGDRTGANFSNTAVMQEFLETLTAVASKTGLFRLTGRVIGLKTIANAMTTTEGRRAVMTALRPGVSDKVAAAAVKTLLIYSENKTDKKENKE